MALEKQTENFNIFEIATTEQYPLLEIVLQNLGFYNFPIDSQNEDGNTLLHILSQQGNKDLVERVIKLRARVNVTNHLNETPFHFAVLGENLDVIKLLIEHGAKVDARNVDGETPLFTAARNDNLGLLRYFKNHHSTHFLHVNNVGENLLHVALSNCASSPVIKFLLKLGIYDINATTLIGTSCLEIAVKNGNREIIKYLLTNGGNAEVKDAKSRTLLHLSIIVGNYKITKLLIDHGVKLEEQDNDGSTPLHYATKMNLKEILLLLLYQNIDANISDLDGYTPLHLAAAGVENLEVLKTLLKYGSVDVTSKTFNGDTPLHIAASNGFFEAVVLLSEKVEITIYNNDAYTALQLAEMQEHKRIIEFLKNFNKSKSPGRKGNVRRSKSLGRPMHSSSPIK